MDNEFITEDHNNKKKNAVGIVSLILSIVGLCPVCGFLFSLAGIILGIVGLKKKDAGKTAATIGIVAGVIGFIINIIAVIAIIISATTPSLIKYLNASQNAQAIYSASGTSANGNSATGTGSTSLSTVQTDIEDDKLLLNSIYLALITASGHPDVVKRNSFTLPSSGTLDTVLDDGGSAFQKVFFETIGFENLEELKESFHCDYKEIYVEFDESGNDIKITLIGSDDGTGNEITAGTNTDI